jgi:hypothetical protein
MSEKGRQSDSNINIKVPLHIINDSLYSKTFVEESDPIYGKDILQGKAIIAGKNITLLKFRPKLKLKEVEIIKPKNGRPRLSAKAWFHFSPPEDDENNHENDYPDIDISKAKDPIEVEADVDISIDSSKGKIQINPKYAVLEAKISSGGGENEPESFCQLSIPLQLEKLKVELPLGVSKFNVPFQAPINKTFINSGNEFPIQGTIDDKDSIVFTYPIALEEQEK